MSRKLFLLIMDQVNGGCDYSIGCGTVVETIWANSKEDAIASVTKLRKDWKARLEKDEDEVYDLLSDCYARYVDPDSEKVCSDITLYEVSGETDLIPLIKETVKEVEQYQEELAKKAKEQAEFKKYQELKSKFERNK